MIANFIFFGRNKIIQKTFACTKKPDLGQPSGGESFRKPSMIQGDPAASRCKIFATHAGACFRSFSSCTLSRSSGWWRRLEDPTQAMSRYTRACLWFNDLGWFLRSFQVENSDIFYNRKPTSPSFITSAGGFMAHPDTAPPQTTNHRILYHARPIYKEQQNTPVDSWK